MEPNPTTDPPEMTPQEKEEYERWLQETSQAINEEVLEAMAQGESHDQR